MLKKISYDEAAKIYNTYLVNHFPANEVKPLKNIEAMWQTGGYEAYGWYEGDFLTGYAFMCKNPAEKYVLLDYLAVLEEYRNGGYGSRILSALKNTSTDSDALIIETEDIDKSVNSEEYAERERRDRFYTRNGIIKSGISATVYSADYRVWYMPLNNTPDETTLHAAYDRIYEYMLSEKGYRDFFVSSRE